MIRLDCWRSRHDDQTLNASVLHQIDKVIGRDTTPNARSLGAWEA